MDGPQKMKTPEEMAEFLRRSGLSEDDVLDLLALTALHTGGWTVQLNRVGLLYLKPEAPEGGEQAA